MKPLESHGFPERDAITKNGKHWIDLAIVDRLFYLTLHERIQHRNGQLLFENIMMGIYHTDPILKMAIITDDNNITKER